MCALEAHANWGVYVYWKHMLTVYISTGPTMPVCLWRTLREPRDLEWMTRGSIPSPSGCQVNHLLGFVFFTWIFASSGAQVRLQGVPGSFASDSFKVAGKPELLCLASVTGHGQPLKCLFCVLGAQLHWLLTHLLWGLLVLEPDNSQER